MVPNFCLGRKLQLQTNFFFLETTFPFLDLRSEGLSSLASLGRQLSFLPTISESESCLSEKKVRLHLYSFPGQKFVTMEELLFLKVYEKRGNPQNLVNTFLHVFLCSGIPVFSPLEVGLRKS